MSTVGNRKHKQRQEFIDAANYTESRRTWDPDPLKSERALARINRIHERKRSNRRRPAI